MADGSDPRNRGIWHDELVDVIRGLSGGLLFGIPLLYTMEMWWTGEHTTPQQGMGVLLLTLVPITALNRTAGFRKRGHSSWRHAVLDAVEALGIGILLSFVILVVLREITAATPAPVAATKVAYEALPFGMGVAIANHLLSGRNDDADRDGDARRDADDDGTGGDARAQHRDNGDRLHGTLADLGAALIGAVFVAFNVAPTEEIPMLASAMEPVWLMVLILFSLAVTHAIVFVAGFAGQEQRHAQHGVLQRPLSETMAAYLVALTGSFVMLWLFQQLSGPPHWMLAQAVVLAFPASIGGAAGRLAV